jgi:hypothetical protein
VTPRHQLGRFAGRVLGRLGDEEETAGFRGEEGCEGEGKRERRKAKLNGSSLTFLRSYLLVMAAYPSL